MASLGLQITLYVVHLTRFDTPIATLSCRYETELQWLSGFRIWLHDSLSFSRHGPSFVQMYTEGLISPQFTFALSQSGGYIVLGATEMSSSFADHERLHLNETQTCTSVNSHTHCAATSTQLACRHNAHSQRYAKRQPSLETPTNPRFDKRHTRTPAATPTDWTAVPMPAYSVGPPIA